MNDIRFPHMYAAESNIWRRWLEIYGKDYLRFSYDLHVGKLYPSLENQDPKWKRGAEAVYLKRIDVVGYQADTETVFEVKIRAGLGALGQIIGYLALYEEQFSPATELKGAIVCDGVDPNVRWILEDHGIELYVMK